MKWGVDMNKKISFDLTNVEINRKQQKLKCVYPPRFKKLLKLEGGVGNESDEDDLDVINCATTVIGKINALKK